MEAQREHKQVQPEQVTADMKALAEAFEMFSRTTQSMEDTYRQLQNRVETLDAELAEKNRELALTSDYMNALLESMSDGVIAVDTQGRITTFNHGAAAILGHQPEEVLGQPFSEVFGRDFSLPPGRHVRELRARDARVLTVSERNSPIADQTGKRLGTAKVFQDLTELQELRTQINQKERLATLGEMAATVAHEIRNPLGGIRGFASLLARDFESHDPRARLVQRIIDGSRDLERVVNELLEYARPLQLRLRASRCRDIVEAALGYLHPIDENIVIVNEVSANLTLHVDGDRVRQVLLNILLNAVQSINGSGRITISSRTDTLLATIVVRDSGCGIPPGQLTKVFSPFYTTKEKGTGLGLPVAAKIVEEHGGAIEAISEPGEGATFFVHLPRVE